MKCERCADLPGDGAEAVVLPEIADPGVRPPWRTERPGMSAWKICRACLVELLEEMQVDPDRFGLPACTRCDKDAPRHAGRYGLVDRPDAPACRAALRRWAAHWDAVGWPPSLGDDDEGGGLVGAVAA